MPVQNLRRAHWPWPKRGLQQKKSAQSHTRLDPLVPPHRHLDRDPAGRSPSAQVSPSLSSRVYHNLCGNWLGGSLTWRHKGRTNFKQCWSDLVNSFGKADTERGCDASGERHEDMHPSQSTRRRTCCPRPRTFAVVPERPGQSSL
jgi:hypothetical protein